jgi:3-(3-hydroxy-phenyl)propionate hydroxylase
VIVDTLVTNMADAAHLPTCFTYYLKRERLAIHAHGFGQNRRWEFQLGDGEATPARDVVLGWLAEFVDPGNLEVTRIVPYEHTALVASTWRAGRLLVAGDAAHMPFIPPGPSKLVGYT